MNTDRTKEEALAEIRYATRLHELHQRLYRRIRLLFTFSTIALGSATAVAALSSVPHAMTTASLLLMLISICDATWNPADLQASHAFQRREFAYFTTRALGMDLLTIDGELAQLRATETCDIEALREVALNDISRTLGWLHNVKPETRWQRFIRAIA